MLLIDIIARISMMPIGLYINYNQAVYWNSLRIKQMLLNIIDN